METGLLSIGQSWDTLADGENVNRRPKTTPSIQTDVITPYLPSFWWRLLGRQYCVEVDNLDVLNAF